jgi:SAM-dependent methyltransferase
VTPPAPGSVPRAPNADLERLRAEYADRERRFAESDRYSLSNPANLFLVQQRQRAVLGMLRRQGIHPLEGRRVLELGCGEGGVLLEFLVFGALPSRLHGTDLLRERVRRGRTRLPHVPLTCGDGQSLPYAAGAFDLVVQYTVFSSILDDEVRANLAGEMLRVLRRPGGMILWYDFWLNPLNEHTRGIRRAEVRRLFPNCRLTFQRTTLAPPLTRRLVNLGWGVCYLLERLALFNTHYLVSIVPDHA